jgi:hypothetical protein
MSNTSECRGNVIVADVVEQGGIGGHVARLGVEADLTLVAVELRQLREQQSLAFIDARITPSAERFA